MKKTFQNLLKIKSLVTLGVLAVFIYGTITGTLTKQDIMVVVTMIVTFYFTKGGADDGNNRSNSE